MNKLPNLLSIALSYFFRRLFVVKYTVTYTTVLNEFYRGGRLSRYVASSHPERLSSVLTLIFLQATSSTMAPCQMCGGTGAHGGFQCGVCGGTGTQKSRQYLKEIGLFTRTCLYPYPVKTVLTPLDFPVVLGFMEGWATPFGKNIDPSRSGKCFQYGILR